MNPTPSTSEAKAVPNDERLVLALLELNTLRERVIGLEKERDFAVSQRESAFTAEDHANGECSELMAERDDANAERDAALRAAEDATAAMMTMRDTVLAEVTERRDWFFARWQESKNAGYVELADKIHWKNEAEKMAKDSYANKSRALNAEEIHAEFCASLADVLHLPSDATASQILQGAIDMISQARTIRADHGMAHATIARLESLLREANALLPFDTISSAMELSNRIDTLLTPKEGAQE